VTRKERHTETDRYRIVRNSVKSTSTNREFRDENQVERVSPHKFIKPPPTPNMLLGTEFEMMRAPEANERSGPKLRNERCQHISEGVERRETDTMMISAGKICKCNISILLALSKQIVRRNGTHHCPKRLSSRSVFEKRRSIS